MYGYTEEEFTDAYDAFVSMYKQMAWNFQSLNDFCCFLAWLPEADARLIKACEDEYIGEFA